MTTLKERFEDRLNGGFFDDYKGRRASGPDILAFIKQELELLAEEVESNKPEDHMLCCGYESTPEDRMLRHGYENVAAIIKNRIQEL